MTEWADVATILGAFHDALGEFRRLRGRLPPGIEAREPEVHIFEGLGIGGAGLDVTLAAMRPDGRRVVWAVELWIDTFGSDGWRVQAKGEIDVDDAAGVDYCVVNEQRSLATAQEAISVILDLTGVVCGHPVDQLLTMRWEDEKSYQHDRAVEGYRPPGDDNA